MQRSSTGSTSFRLRSLIILIFVLGGIAVARLVYLQIFQHDHYAALADSRHQRKYEVPAPRGQIYLHDGEQKVPLALNQTLKLVYADPSIITDKESTARKLAEATGDKPESFLEAINKGGEYVVLKTRVNDQVADKIKASKLRGVGMVNQDYRSYPEGSLGSQILGFVNGEGKGQYGVEGALDSELRGKAGLLNAKTDTNGIPIATTDNLSRPAEPGTDLVLTIDRNVQAQAEKFLKEGVESTRADSGSVVVMDPRTGAVKAMANFPSFDPNSYQKVKDYTDFENDVVSSSFEPGSGFKAFTMAAGLDAGKVKPDTSYKDDVCIEINKYKVCNADNHGGGTQTMTTVLRDSLNTGVIFVLRQLGSNPDKITFEGKKNLHHYFTEQFGFGNRTGIEQSIESKGLVNPPSSSDVNYANMTFGQGLSVTMIQMATAMSAVANGGTLYKPYVVEERVAPDGSSKKTRPQVVKEKVISKQAATDLTEMMKVVVEHGSGYLAKTPGYNIAGKTGTAQIADPNGGYLKQGNIGTFTGFAPAESPKFVVMVRVNKPKIEGYAEKTTVPIFANLTRWLLQYYAVPPNGQ